MKKKVILMIFVAFIIAGCAEKDVKQASTEVKTKEISESLQEPDLEELAKSSVLCDYSKIPVDTSLKEVTDEDVENELNNYMEYAASYEHITEGKVQDGDTVNIHFVGRMNGEAFDGGTGEYDLTIGSGSFIPGFEEGLIGAEIGDTVTLDLTFPDQYEESLAGKDVEFEVTINYKNGEPIEAELTDEFVKETFGFDTVSAFKEDIRSNLKRQNELNHEYEVNDLVFRYVGDNSKVPAIPMPYIDEYVKDAKLYYLDYAKQNGIEGDNYIEQLTGVTEDEFTQQTETVAEEYYKQQVLLLALAEDMGIEVSDEDFESYLEEQAEEYGYDSKETLRKELEENGMIETFKKEILYNKVLERLKENIV